MDQRTRNTIASYNQVAAKYAKLNNTLDFWDREAKIFLRLIHGQRVLEIGCGYGKDAKILIRKGFDYTGIDASSGMLKLARTRNPSGKFQRMDLYDLDFKPESFDGLWCVATLLHVPKRRIKKVLRSIVRLLAPGGVAVFSMKKKSTVDEEVVYSSRYGVPRFFAYYRKAEFAGLLRQAGFRIVKIFEKQTESSDWMSFVVIKNK